MGVEALQLQGRRVVLLLTGKWKVHATRKLWHV